jgi:hypothetical protein
LWNCSPCTRPLSFPPPLPTLTKLRMSYVVRLLPPKINKCIGWYLPNLVKSSPCMGILTGISSYCIWCTGKAVKLANWIWDIFFADYVNHFNYSDRAIIRTQ